MPGNQHEQPANELKSAIKRNIEMFLKKNVTHYKILKTKACLPSRRCYTPISRKQTCATLCWPANKPRNRLTIQADEADRISYCRGNCCIMSTWFQFSLLAETQALQIFAKKTDVDLNAQDT